MLRRQTVADVDGTDTKEAWEGTDQDAEPTKEVESSGRKKARRVCKSICVHLGLVSVVAIYCVGGAFMFQAIEGGEELRRAEEDHDISQQIGELQAKMGDDLWSQRGNATFDDKIDKWLHQYQSQVSNAVKKHKYKGRVEAVNKDELGWNFLSGLLFCVTVVTTIGYGHVAPVTWVGQVVTIFYSLIGIPLMLMFLANIGEVMANMFRIAYGRGCCYFCWKKRRANYEYNRQMVIKARERRANKSAWESSKDERNTLSERSRSPSPVVEGVSKRKRRKSDEIDWDYLSTIDPDTIKCPDEEVVNVPITLTLVVIAVYVFVGAIIFAALEQWSWIKGAYFSFVTLSTIGFGDLVPGWGQLKSTGGAFKLMASLAYIILGLAVLSMSFNLMMEEMLAKFRWVGYKLGIIEDPEKKKFDEMIDRKVEEEMEQSDDMKQ